MTIVGLVVGAFIMVQAHSFQSLSDVLVGRDSHTNVFQEIQILIQTNKGLEQEIADLQSNLEQLSSRASALQAIEGEIAKYRKLTGQSPISGSGLELSISENIGTIWLVDLVNELFASGAEAVSVNDIRFTNYTNGFDTLPQGQILFNGTILKTPLLIKAIGNSGILLSILEQPKGMIDKLYEHNKSIKITTSKKELIEMTKVI